MSPLHSERIFRPAMAEEENRSIFPVQFCALFFINFKFVHQTGENIFKNSLLNIDSVLDPFWGTGTTTTAAIVSARNSIGYEIDPSLEKVIDYIEDAVIGSSAQLIRKRLARHIEFVIQQLKTNVRFKYDNLHYGLPVTTAQEKELLLNDPLKIMGAEGGSFEVEYPAKPQPEFCINWSVVLQFVCPKESRGYPISFVAEGSR
jgi:DNA methylase